MNATIAVQPNGYAVAWQDNRSGNYDIYATLLDANGIVTSHDSSFPAGGDQTAPSIVWARASREYVVAWQDTRSGKSEIYTGQILPDGYASPNGVVITSAGSAYAPSLAETGQAIGLAWYDTRDGNNEIYATILNSSGTKVGTETRLTNDAANSVGPVLVWTGGEYGAFWQDTRSGSPNFDVFFQRVAPSGAAIGGNVPLTTFAMAGNLRASFGSKGYLATFSYGQAYALPVGCTSPLTPTCPEAPDAYGITGSTATVSWLPAVDRYTEIAYYQVFRNNRLVGLTSNNYFNDSGLSPGTTYQYNFRTVNAAQLESYGCTDAQIYVKSSASLSLSVDRTASGDIGLRWNDDGSNVYRVMRGTSPQVMEQLQSTTGTSATDPAAALGTVCYYYSIDEPPSTLP